MHLFYRELPHAAMNDFQTKPNCIGLLLAAGRGRRMGGNKQFHLIETPEGKKPLVAAAFDTITNACDRMIVVLGHRADEVAAVLAPRPFEVVEADPDARMFDSILAGLRAASTQRTPLSGASQTPLRSGYEQVADSILLQLGDHPTLLRTTLDLLLEQAATNPDRAIMPTYHGNGGHPVVIPPIVAKRILDEDCPGGLRQFWIDHPELCLRIEVDDPGVIQNINSL